jgi:hypothetical protein
MPFFIGRERDNHVPLGNGRVLATLQQFGPTQEPMDRLSQLYFPSYEPADAMLGEGGVTMLAHDEAEKIWYDPLDVVRTRTGQYGEVVCLDGARFVDGTALYEVLSHKGVNRIKSTTWVLRGEDAVVRRLEVGSMKRTPSHVTTFPVVHLRNPVRAEGDTIVCEVGGRYLAVACPEAEAWHMGDLAEGLIDGFNRRIPSVVRLDPRWRARDVRLTFRVARAVPPRPELPGGGWAEPVHLVFGLGGSEAAALAALAAARARPGLGHDETLAEGRRWLAAGVELEASQPELAYLWRVSLTLLRTALQADGAPVIAGFREYQGRVWVRDGLWMAMALARAGHLPEALAALRRIAALLRHRPDGNFYFAYNCATGEPQEHTFENDTTGLLIAGIWCCYEASGDEAVLREFWPLVTYCAEWILGNRGPEGFVHPCAGIWETFGPHLERSHETMAWTTGISAWGLRKAGEAARCLGRPAPEAWEEAAAAMVAGLRALAGPGPLPRSRETHQLDSAVLAFWTWFPLFEPDDPLVDRTMAAVQERLVDPALGGLWRHEDLTTEWGDMRPWIGPTWWLGEAHLRRGEPARAWDAFGWCLAHRSHCGLFPEMMYAHDIPRGVAMPSYSQGGFVVAMLRHRDPATGAVLAPGEGQWLRWRGLPASAPARAASAPPPPAARTTRRRGS